MVQCSQARARKRISARRARGRASGGLEVIIPRAQSRVHGKSCARGFYFVWIFLKKGVDIGRISSYNNKALRRYAVNAMRNCVMVAPATLTRIVRVRILLPQPQRQPCAAVFFRGVAQMVARLVRDQEARSSTLLTPTILKNRVISRKRLGYAVFCTIRIALRESCFGGQPEGRFYFLPTKTTFFSNLP